MSTENDNVNESPKDNVVDFNGVTKLDLDPDRILDAAKGELEGGFVIGTNKEGNLYFASSYADGPTIVWLMEQAKLALMGIYPDE